MKNSYFLSILSPISKRNSKNFIEGKKRVIYIVSTGRTGTKFFADYFNKFSDVKAVHEPSPSRILRMWTNARLEKRATASRMLKIFISKRRVLLNRVSEPIYIESNPFVVGFTDILPQAIDTPEIIHIVRDPRTYIKSALNHGNTHGVKKIMNSYLPYWYPNISKITHARHQLTEKDVVAHYWTIINQFLEEAKKSIPTQNYHLFKYEDIFKNENSIKKISKIVGSKDKKNHKIKAVNKSKDRVITDWSDWSKEDCRSINKICGKLMKYYGYGDEKLWLEKLK